MAQLICLRQGNSNTIPIYCLPTAAGSVSIYDELAQTLGSDRSIFGFRVINRDSTGKLIEFSSLRDIAGSIVASFRVQHSGGPAYLLGYSFGGPLAVEVARQLVENGERIPLVVIVDQPPTRSSFTYCYRVVHFLKYVAPWARRIASQFLGSASQRKRYWQALVLKLQRKRKLEAEKWYKELPEERQAYITHNMASWVSFRFEGRYSGDIFLIRQSPDMTNNSDPVRMRQLVDYGWHHVTGARVHVVCVPGNHASFMQGPDVELVAHELRRVFENFDSKSACCELA